MIAARRGAPPPSPPAGIAADDRAAAAAAPRCVARLLPLGPGFYAFGLAAASGSQGPAPGLAVPSVQVCPPPGGEATIEISDAFGGAGCWLGGRHAMLFVSVPPGGGAALITAYLADAPVELEICRVGVAGPPPPDAAKSPLGERLRLMLAAPEMAAPPSNQVGLETVVHVRGRGDVRYVDAPWVGRFGRGLWIEALTLVPHDVSAAPAIEYKGLTAGGAETEWTGCGRPCGTQGRGLPLTGIAVRQKPGSAAALFDCEYTGYFQSGATAGPARNGAPCRSSVDDDPLEGLQLRITRRSPTPRSARK